MRTKVKTSGEENNSLKIFDTDGAAIQK